MAWRAARLFGGMVAAGGGGGEHAGFTFSPLIFLTKRGVLLSGFFFSLISRKVIFGRKGLVW